MRVAHLIRTGTGATWAWRQIAELSKAGIDIEVVLSEPGPMEARYREIGVPVHVLPSDIGRFRSPIRLARAMARFRALIRTMKPDLIHSHSVGGTMFARLALGRTSPIPRIFQIPGPLHMEHLHTRRAELFTSGPRDWWLPSSDYTRQLYLRAGVAPERMDISYYGPDITAFQKGDGSKIRKEFGVPAAATLVVMVAYFYAPKRWLGQTRGLKGHEDLIDAAARLVKEGRDIFVLFVGSAWGRAAGYETAVKRYAAERLGARALFAGLRHDVQDIYAAADLSVAPSFSENLGSPVESLAATVPTIASRAGGLVEIVQHERTGLLFEPRNPDDLADKLAWMLDHPDHARKWAEAGRAWIETHLPINVAARQIENFYRRILDA